MRHLPIDLKAAIALSLSIDDCTALICTNTEWYNVLNSVPVLFEFKTRYNLQLPRLGQEKHPEDTFFTLLREHFFDFYENQRNVNFEILLKISKLYDKRYLTRRCYKYRSKADCLRYTIKHCPEKLDMDEFSNQCKKRYQDSCMLHGALAKYGCHEIIKTFYDKTVPSEMQESLFISGVVKCKDETARALIEAMIICGGKLVQPTARREAFQGNWEKVIQYERDYWLAEPILDGFILAGNVPYFLRYAAFYLQLDEQSPPEEILSKLVARLKYSNFIYSAAKSGCLEIFLLIDKFYQSESVCELCFLAAEKGDLPLFHLLFKRFKKEKDKTFSEKQSNSFLVAAIKKGFTQIVRYLSNKSYINHRQVLRNAIVEGRLDYINLFINTVSGECAKNLFDAEMQQLVLESRFPELLPYIKS